MQLKEQQTQRSSEYDEYDEDFVALCAEDSTKQDIRRLMKELTNDVQLEEPTGEGVPEEPSPCQQDKPPCLQLRESLEVALRNCIGKHQDQLIEIIFASLGRGQGPWEARSKVPNDGSLNSGIELRRLALEAGSEISKESNLDGTIEDVGTTRLAAGKEEEGAQRRGSRTALVSGKKNTFKEHMTRFEKGNFKQNCAGDLVQRQSFDRVCATCIVLSAIGMAIELELKTKSNTWMFDAIGYTFIVLFSMELGLRVVGLGRNFYTGLDQGWNFFDAFCVLTSWLEVILTSVATETSVLGIVRTLRIIRIVRIVRVIKFLRRLRTMVYTMLGAMQMLGWAAMLLTMISYMFGVCFTEAANSVFVEDDNKSFSAEQLILLEGYFGNLFKSMTLLFQSISNGVSWREAVLLLELIHPVYMMLFLVYICVSVLTMLNVITGLCCDYAIQNAVADREDAIRNTLQDLEKWKKQFSQTFATLDEDGSGEVSSDELARLLHDESFNAYLTSLNVNVDDAMDLFNIFDKDESGSVSIDEFVSGCMRVKGFAKTIDVMKIKQDTTCLFQELAKLNAILAVRAGAGPQ